MRLLITLEETFLTTGPPDNNESPDEATCDRWRQRYAAAACRLREAGVGTANDETAGAELYVKLRACWNAHIERLAPAMPMPSPAPTSCRRSAILTAAIT
jgi:hypothetical protein